MCAAVGRDCPRRAQLDDLAAVCGTRHEPIKHVTLFAGVDVLALVDREARFPACELVALHRWSDAARTQNLHARGR